MAIREKCGYYLLILGMSQQSLRFGYSAFGCIAVAIWDIPNRRSKLCVKAGVRESGNSAWTRASSISAALVICLCIPAYRQPTGRQALREMYSKDPRSSLLILQRPCWVHFRSLPALDPNGYCRDEKANQPAPMKIQTLSGIR